MTTKQATAAVADAIEDFAKCVKSHMDAGEVHPDNVMRHIRRGSWQLVAEVLMIQGTYSKSDVSGYE